MEGISGDQLVQLFVQVFSSRARCQVPCPDRYWLSPEMEPLLPLRATCASAWSPSQYTKLCLMFNHCFGLRQLPLLLPLHTTEKSLSLSSLLFSIRYLCRWLNPTLSRPFSMLYSHCYLTLSSYITPWSPLWPSAELVPMCSCLSGAEEARNGGSSPGVFHLLSRRERSSSLTDSDALPNAAQKAVGLLCCKGTFLTHVQLGVHQEPLGLFHKPAFQLAGPSLYWCGGLFLCAELGISLCWIS